jgi:uncharacterized protein YbbC (DUF1343 family)
MLVVAVMLTGACSPVDDSLESKSEVVQVGLDRIAAGFDADLHDTSIGLVVHAASVSADGRHAIDVMRDAELQVVRLFTPEHGLRSRAAAGEHVESGADTATGLPVVSLYGAHRKPTAEDLQDLDVLVFDLQGAGVRFYTYVSTLILTLEAAAESGLELVVLDRPNPLGGERVEGPISADRDVVPESFVNRAPGPLVHGLTLGEMALFVNQNLKTPARLSVVPMSGWKRSMTWAETGRVWVPPSPNLRSPEAALAYPGTALLEATNVSEGRGTPSPFLLFGAPWFEPERLNVSAPGFELVSTRFTPITSPAAPSPKYLDEECHGVEVRVVDADSAQPYRLGVSLLAAASKQAGFEWSRDGQALTWLVGTPRLREDLVSGKTVEQIVEADFADHNAWRQSRSGVLLY